MKIKRWQITVINSDIKRALKDKNDCIAWLVVANDRESAWRKFIVQHFGVLKPSRGDYELATTPLVDPS